MDSRSYKDAALEARKIMREGGDSETLRIAVGKSIQAAPTEEDREYWRAVAGKLAAGLEVHTKELET